MGLQIEQHDDFEIYTTFRERLSPQKVRPIRVFSEEEIVLPKGPRKSMHFKTSYMPFTDFVFKAMEDPWWRKLAIVGPTQSGKSLINNNIPILYYLFEAKEDIIVGIPDMDLARGIWLEKIMPVIEHSRYKELLPTKGAGARGGTPTAIQFKNGVWMRFMGAGGGDAQRSSHTARIIIMTEIDKMDDVGEASEEADPVSQIEMRADSFEDSKIIMECTVTHDEGRIWQEAMITGSGGRVYVPCPKCGTYQTLEKERLIFDDRSMVSAEESAYYLCIKCEAKWDNRDRNTALDTPVLVHRGQEINLDGIVLGELPETRTFGLHYNVLYSPMQSIGKTAGQQWDADHSALETKRKAMLQSKWALPWSNDDEKQRELSVSFLRKREAEHEGEIRKVPDWTQYLTMTVDIQKDRLYWHVDAWGEHEVNQVVDKGIEHFDNVLDEGVAKSLSKVCDFARIGWETDGEFGKKVFTPKTKLIDTGYNYRFISKWLKKNKDWKGCKGYGVGQARPTGEKAIYEITDVLQLRRQTDGNIICFVDTISVKSLVTDRYFGEPEQVGYTIVPVGAESQNYYFHLTSEERYWDDKKKMFLWRKRAGRGRNDFFDCRVYSLAAARLAQRQLKKEGLQKQASTEQESRNERRPNGFTAFINRRGRY